MSLVLSYYTMFFLIAYALVSSYSVAFLVYLLIEYPIDKLLRKKRSEVVDKADSFASLYQKSNSFGVEGAESTTS